MIQILALPLLVISLWIAPSYAASDIRGIDFLNFTYEPTYCADEFGDMGIGKTVQVRNGEWRGKKEASSGQQAYYGVKDVIYGDLTGDGREDAVVDIFCHAMGNFGVSELLVFSMQGQKPVVVARLNDDDLAREYKRYNPNCTESDDNPTCGVWDGIRDAQIIRGKLVVENFAEGSHAGPKHIVRFTFRVEDGKLVLAQKPQKRPNQG